MNEDHDHEHLRDGGRHHRVRGARRFLAKLVRPHSHDAADSPATALEASGEGIRTLQISLAVLAVTAGLQFVLVLVSGSVALLADTIHNFTDALTAVPLGLAFWLGQRPPTRRYTFGYGRAEDLAGVFIVAVIALSSAVAVWEAVQRLVHPQDVRNVGWVIAAGVLGAVGNEWVAAYRIRVGRRIGSAALVADGFHARSDGLTSLAVAVGAVGVAFGFELADPIVGLLISVVILGVLRNAARDVYRRLMDSVDPSLVEEVEAVIRSVPGVEAVESARVRWVGHELRVEAEIVSDADLPFVAAHAIAEEAHHQLLHHIPCLVQATIHSSPRDRGGTDHHTAIAHHRPTRS